jgi:hypothetical protein
MYRPASYQTQADDWIEDMTIEELLKEILEVLKRIERNQPNPLDQP